MFLLSVDGRRVVEALVKAPVAWQSPAELASAIGRGLDETTDVVAVLDAEGWLAAWEREADVVVTLSVAGASKLGVRLVESGRDETPRWAGTGDPEPPSPVATGVFRGERAARLELVVDPSRPPDEAIDRAEAALGRASPSTNPRPKISVDALPRPTLLIGSGLTPWPGPVDGQKDPCPACRSMPLGPSAYCLYCDRWGLDHLFRDDPAPRPKALPDPSNQVGRRNRERRARKEKRQARRLAQVTAEKGSKRPRRA